MNVKILALGMALTAAAACNKAAPTNDAANETEAKPADAAAQALAAKAEAKPEAKPADAHDAFTNLSIEKVSALVASGDCVAVDANSADTRKELGVVPNAILLSNYRTFDASELPADKGKKLVFYCGSEACMSAPKAAEVAQAAGYTDVNVMRSGIKGWVGAGQKVDKPAS
jgi:rhodanese-related sulfurtransferase